MTTPTAGIDVSKAWLDVALPAGDHRFASDTSGCRRLHQLLADRGAAIHAI